MKEKDLFDDVKPVSFKRKAGKSYYSGNSMIFSDLVDEKFTPEQIMAIDEFNIFKYMWRWKEKNGSEDLKKAQYYLSDLIGKAIQKEIGMIK